MTLLELAQNLGFDLKKTSNCKGGEYHSACPACGEGIDRFVIWSELNRYWCRRCGVSGDAIQFCRDFMKLSFREACYRINDTTRLHTKCQLKRSVSERFSVAQEPPKIWQDKASTFVDWTQKQLERTPIVMKELYQRGFRDETIIQNKLGYVINPSSVGSRDFFRERSEWGLPCEYKTEGKRKKLWLPSGLLIPTISNNGGVYKLKVRRQEWYPQDPLPKYVEISGSKSSPSLHGDITSSVAIVLESELDSVLIQQEASDVCFCVALGGSTKKPDFYTDHLLRKFKLILWCLDNDEAGRKAALWWRETYPHLKFWPVPIGKSPGDALKDHGINLREWILRGIAKNSEVSSQVESIDKPNSKEIFNHE
jgi:hypothetical protein